MRRDKDTAGIVLCGGQSTRMGRAKADLLFGNETLLVRMIRILHASCSHVVVVAAEGQPVCFENSDSVSITRDTIPGGGPLIGIREGLNLAYRKGYKRAFVTSCDAPFLKPKLIDELLTRQAEYDVVVPRGEKHYYPLTALYKTTLGDRIQALLDQDERRPRTLFQKCTTLEVAVSDLKNVDPDLHSFLNLNTPQDYRSALELANFPIPDWLDQVEKHG